NMPGYQNGIPDGGNVMANWWQFTADWDAAIFANRGLSFPPRVRFSVESLSHGNNTYSCTLTGDAGFGYSLEASTDLVQWTNLAYNTNFNGAWQIQDTLLQQRRFYRTRKIE